MSLSDKKCAVNLGGGYSYPEEDVKQFIKDRLKLINYWIDKVDEAHAQCSMQDIKTKRSRLMVECHSILCDIRNDLEDEAGEALVE